PPVYNWRYGIPNANRLPSYINLKKGLKILEIPISTLQLTGFNFPIGGGAYFRIYPYFFIKKCIKYLEDKQEKYNMYIHPWELDPDHPKINLPFRVSSTHYFNLSSTEVKLKSLVENFKFSTYKEVYCNLIKSMSVSD
ncbi:MAG: DUF3473 domain-containing protein, partial [Oscillatoria sp. SIO1A7]|nr:DUF3473 domain-containing protein [Oscillatoria sp. SIO1A7]